MITDDALANVMLDFHIDAWLSNHINLTFPTTPRMVYFHLKKKLMPNGFLPSHDSKSHSSK